MWSTGAVQWEKGQRVDSGKTESLAGNTHLESDRMCPGFRRISSEARLLARLRIGGKTEAGAVQRCSKRGGITLRGYRLKYSAPQCFSALTLGAERLKHNDQDQ